MRWYTVLASRPQYYDRSPVVARQQYAAQGVAPAGATVRWTYTVPTATKVFVQSVMVAIMRDAAAAAAGDALLNVRYYPQGVSNAGIITVEEISNTVGNQRLGSFSATGLAVAADVIDAVTIDGSTGGTYTYRGSMWYTEYSA